jgi:cobalt-zinc-cadmium efflux system membrane fusion protein
MKYRARLSGKVLFWVLAAVGVTAFVAAMVASTLTPNRGAVAKSENPPSLRLLPGSNNTLELSRELVNSLGVRTVQVQSAASHDRLDLSGSLILDSNRMAVVHSRFAGEVVLIGTTQPTGPDGKAAAARPLRLGDPVTKGQLLAVIWSKDVGGEKSDLVDALSKLYMDEAQLKSIRPLGKDVLPQREVRKAEREREADINDVNRHERTLRSWRLTEEEIDVVRAEAKKIHEGKVDSDIAIDKSWAEVEVRSPFDGIILEKNIVPGAIVDTNLDLFKIADLTVLGVMANVYEEDLPALESLKPDDRRWTVVLKSQINSAGIPGKFDLIVNIVDPMQHTAAVMGWLDNQDLRLRIGQFITATVDLPAAAGEVVLPDTALVQDGSQCVVFVASDESGREVTRRNVALISRGQDMAYLRAQPTPEEKAKGCLPLKPGEWVVASGCIELDGALENALATAPQRGTVQN